MRAGQYMPRDARVALMTERATERRDLVALSPEAAGALAERAVRCWQERAAVSTVRASSSERTQGTVTAERLTTLRPCSGATGQS